MQSSYSLPDGAREMMLRQFFAKLARVKELGNDEYACAD
jgi:hypothetical protein